MPKGSTKDWEDNSLKGGQGEARHSKVDETMGQRGVEHTIPGTPNIYQPAPVRCLRCQCMNFGNKLLQAAGRDIQFQTNRSPVTPDIGQPALVHCQCRRWAHRSVLEVFLASEQYDAL